MFLQVSSGPEILLLFSGFHSGLLQSNFRKFLPDYYRYFLEFLPGSFWVFFRDNSRFTFRRHSFRDSGKIRFLPVFLRFFFGPAILLGSNQVFLQEFLLGFLHRFFWKFLPDFCLGFLQEFLQVLLRGFLPEFFLGFPIVRNLGRKRITVFCSRDSVWDY